MRGMLSIHAALGFILIITGSPCFSSEPNEPTNPDNAEQIRRYIYKHTAQGELEMFIHLPNEWTSTDKRPAIVFFFGGAFRTGTIKEFIRHADYLASRGMVAARADYRVKDRHGTMPDKCVEDAKSAVRWLRSNANKFGIDPDRIAASGHSAGGHISACASTTIGLEAEGEDLSISSKPSLLVLFNTSLDINMGYAEYLGSKEIADSLSPYDNLTPDLPPAILFYGVQDPSHLKDGLDFVYKSGKLGNKAELYAAEGQSHNFSKSSPWFERTLYLMDQFLAKHGYLAGEPTVSLPQGKVGMSRMTPDDFDHTPLHIAARSGDKELVQALIADGIDVNLKNRWRQTALYLAAHISGDMEIVQILINAGADLNVKDRWGCVMLHYAAEHGRKELAALLISNGVDVNTTGNLGETPIETAMNSNHTEIVEFLLSKGADIPPLHLALFSKDRAKVKDLIEAGVNVNERTPYGTSPLRRAIQAGLADIALFLIENGADVNAKDNWDWTPLHSAVSQDQHIVSMLISKGASIDARDGATKTPLWYAKKNGNTEIVDLLLSKGADVNTTLERAWTPLHLAIQQGNQKQVEFLLDQGAGVNSQGYRGQTPIETAMSGNHTKIVELVLSKGADISPLHLALYSKDETRVKGLIETGANVNERTSFGTSPLHKAILAGLADVAVLLIEKGADVNVKDNWDWTPLHTAAERGHRNLAELLIAKGADVNAKDGASALPCGMLKMKATLKSSNSSASREQRSESTNK